MSEYISREELIDRLRKTELSAEQIRMLVYPREAVVGAIYDCPPADVRPNIHGHWIDEKVGRWFAGDTFKCSECGNTLNRSGVNCGRGDANFCPNCGADMREPKGEKGKT